MTDLRPYLKAVSGSSKLTYGDRLVLYTLAWYANDTGHAWPNSKTLGNDCGLHPTFVRRALGRLVRAGVIAVETHRTGRSTVYRFPLHPSTACNQANTGQAEEPAIARLRGCNQIAPNLQSPDCTDLKNLKEEEEPALSTGDGIPGWLAERWADRLAR
jgi:Helix-turn-helix domain